MLKKLIEILFKEAINREYIVYRKTQVLFKFSLFILFVIPVILIIYLVSGRLTNNISITLISLLAITLLIQIFLYRGMLKTYTHSLLITFLLTLWIVIIFDTAKPLPSRMDTVIFISVLLAMTPMTIFNSIWTIVFYFTINIMALTGYAFFLYEKFNFSIFTLKGYILDNTISLTVLAVVCYYIYHTNLKSLQRAEKFKLDTEERNRELTEANKKLESLNDELSHSRDELKTSEERYRLLYHEAPVGMITVSLPEGEIFKTNAASSLIFGFGENHDLREDFSFFSLFYSESEAKDFTSELLKSGEIFDREIRLKGRDENFFWGAITAKLSLDDSKAEIVLIDISQRKIAENYIHQLTFFDSLTGFPNKKLLAEHMFSEIKKTQRKSHGKIFGLMSILVENYKNFSDTHGASEANSLLRKTSRKLKTIFRDDDILARYDEDKFMVFLTEVNSTDDIKKIADKLFSQFSKPLLINNIQTKINLICGISIYPNDGNTPELLIKNSELALYMARKKGRNNYHLFDADLNEELLHHIYIEEELQTAIIENQLISYYQPRIDSDGKLRSAESLLRWFSPSSGTIFPEDFIPIAEKTGLIREIGKKTLLQACKQIKEWHKSSDNYFFISVNVSPVELMDRDFVSTLIETVQKHDVKPEYIELEITEQSLVYNEADAVQKLEKIHQMGFKIAIDDFGTGYSSLSKLKDMPIDTIKIDKSFISQVPSDEKAVTIVRAIIKLASSLGFSITVEGVETREQLDFLKNLPINEFQGYYFSRPLSPEDFHKKYLSNGKQ